MGLTPPSDAARDTWLDLKQTQDKAQLVCRPVMQKRIDAKLRYQLGKTLYHQGDLSYFEAVNKETLKNAFQLFEEEGIIVLSESRDSKIPTMVKLVTEWTPGREEHTGGINPHGRLWEFAETIAQSRREG